MSQKGEIDIDRLIDRSIEESIEIEKMETNLARMIWKTSRD